MNSDNQLIEKLEIVKSEIKELSYQEWEFITKGCEKDVNFLSF